MFDMEKVVGEWIDMWNSYDLNRVKDLFLDSQDLTYFSSDKEGPIKGLEGVINHHSGFGFVPGGRKQGNKLWVENLQSFPLESAVVVTGLWHFRRIMGMHQWGPFTFVYIEKDGRHLLAHLHFSRYPDNPPETT